MPLLVVGVNHQAAPVEVRERLALQGDALERALEAARQVAGEVVILSTCNRTEVYGLMGHLRSGERDLRRFVAGFPGLPPDFDDLLYAHAQLGAARHLFRVAASLDSMIVGEAQVLGQVRDAFELARARGATGPIFSRLFRQAIRVGKLVRSTTDIGRHPVSVSYAAAELARQVFGDLSQQRVLVAGAGEVAELTLRHLADKGVGPVTVLNRTFEKARELAGAYGGRAFTLEAMPQALAQADIAIGSTGAPGFVVGPEEVERAMAARGHRPMLFIDVAVPRDVDPRVGAIPNTHLYDIDDLAAVCAQNLEQRQREAQKVEALLDEEAERFMQWWRALEVVPTITALRARADEVREAELRKALARLGEISDRQRNVITAMSLALVNKLLHAPVTQLKSESGAFDYARVVRHLFQLESLPADLDDTPLEEL